MPRSLVGLGLVVVLGCHPSRESMTAGQVGCPPSEVRTYDAGSSGGFFQTAESWIAECRGRRFVCTEVTTSSSDFTWLFTDATDSVDSDVACHEELPASNLVIASPGSNAGSEAEVMAQSAPPSSAGGFEFGFDRAAAQASCERAGHTWHEDASAHATCSGTASSTGFAAQTKLTYCAGGLCGVTITHTPKNDWAESFTDIDSALTAKYGKPTSRQVVIPTMCRKSEEFDRCAIDGTLALKVSWQWPGGQRVKLFLGKPSPHTGDAAVQLTYVQRSRKPRADTSAL